jgi:hypothetical protein
MASFCKHGNEPSRSINGREFYDYLIDYYEIRLKS